MSTTSEHNTSTCANCGKDEDDNIKLKTCTACKLVKYCSRDCQVAHRPQHKKECKRRAKELHDEKLFKQPSLVDDDCPICMIRLPSLSKGRTYMACCGKSICTGCVYAPLYDHQGNQVDNDKQNECPFCRTLAPKSDEEAIKRYEKRAEMNDPIAICDLGCYYKEGSCGLPQNMDKAFDLWHQAGELGYASAYYNIGCAHTFGRGVDRDEKKAMYYWGLAAMIGDVNARFNLGYGEVQAGNMDRALKHYMIAVKDGCADSLENIKKMYEYGDATKDDYAKALQSYQAYIDEIKSKQRDEAAASDEYQNYY